MRNLTIIECDLISGSHSACVAASTLTAALVGGMVGATFTGALGSYLSYIGTPAFTAGFTLMCSSGPGPIMLMCGTSGMILGSILNSSIAPALGFITAGPTVGYLTYSLQV